ncbi:Ribosomal protein S12 methylthiotransferase RimO [Nitrospira sp. KM1]|uniref:30S ribosomal protein S12 methylthiotransferase RimO n=1 Tax=Nitrospira sp. KM1 TaxID=1936990 RepID=UPI0013A72A23|nr:30S ribosomal protein S12 methylthiotransferase RimO [Nitrospira sp. KM1]BCA55433.1 Ribosomal protein S12 methylthiotransferase RimO [Nitrospira sp. KM1]
MGHPLITPRRAGTKRASTKKGATTKIGFVNLGCSKNQVDSEVMLGTLVNEGFELTGDPKKAEVVIINTCGFIEEAKQESIDAILEHGRLKKDGICRVLIAAGCLAQRYQGELLKELPELDGVVGTGEFGNIADICRDLLSSKRHPRRLWISQPPYLYDEMAPRMRLGRHHSAYIKIAEGCNRNCAFCAIPLMRGKQRSRSIESIVGEARRLAGEGVKEINLISQDTVNYGVDLGLRHGLASLLRELVKVKALHWIRPFYLYPQQVTDELLDLYAGEERITKYIDMPLQHISDRMLKRMHRLGDRHAIERLVERIRERIPGVFFRTAFIVGFPGETDQDFEELARYVGDAQFDRVAAFLYSDEEQTPAASLDAKIDRSVMHARRNELLSVQEEIASAKNRAYIGTTLEVLIDGRSEESEYLLEGRHQRLAPEIDGVVYINDGMAGAGTLVHVEVTDAAMYDLVGRVAGAHGNAPSVSKHVLTGKTGGYR